ncbi:hypothetical protein SAMN05660206_104188 [Sphingobacterium wenxiniae]|uniref:Uncharacterized protein n=1 Tax=Sphingobacterium wenxiniae TaxID=683125 RepID=A0A1I6SAI1_9SPHI|nr:hypothetical protein SAMN05660206_104188 [Sphingobacterium wenxiniae]
MFVRFFTKSKQLSTLLKENIFKKTGIIPQPSRRVADYSSFQNTLTTYENV